MLGRIGPFFYHTYCFFILNSLPSFCRYNLTYSKICNNRGGSLLLHFNNSPFLLVSGTYPDYDWLPWLFPNCPHSYFDSAQNRIRYVEWLMKKVGVTSSHKLQTAHFLENNGGGLLRGRYAGSPQKLIASLSAESETSSQGSSTLDRQVRPRRFWVRRSVLIARNSFLV
jgi:hypothetical protein